MKYFPDKLSAEHLVFELQALSTQEVIYPAKTVYRKKRILCEKELIRRLGADWNEYCRINGWNPDELEDVLKGSK